MTKFSLPDGRTAEHDSAEFKAYRLDSLILQCEEVIRQNDQQLLGQIVTVENDAGQVAAIWELAGYLRDLLRQPAFNTEAMKKRLAEIRAMDPIALGEAAGCRQESTGLAEAQSRMTIWITAEFLAAGL